MTESKPVYAIGDFSQVEIDGLMGKVMLGLATVKECERLQAFVAFCFAEFEKRQSCPVDDAGCHTCSKCGKSITAPRFENGVQGERHVVSIPITWPPEYVQTSIPAANLETDVG